MYKRKSWGISNLSLNTFLSSTQQLHHFDLKDPADRDWLALMPNDTWEAKKTKEVLENDTHGSILGNWTFP